MGILIRFALFLLLFAASTSLAASNLELQEQEIKAGLLYNFLKYTDWPEASFAAPSVITVCIFGNDPFNGNLKPMEGRTVNQREITIRQVRDVQGIAGCQL